MVDPKSNLLQRCRLTDTCRAEPGTSADRILRKAKVLAYAPDLPVQFEAILEPDYVRTLRASMLDTVQAETVAANVVIFDGSTASQLNRFLAALPSAGRTLVRLTSPELNCDEPVRFRSGTWLCGSATLCRADRVDIAFLGQKVEDAALTDIIVTRPRVCAVMLRGCTRVNLERLTVRNGQDYGVVVRGRSSLVRVASCVFRDNVRAGVMIEDGSHHVLVSACEITGSRHSSNWAAGVVISALRPVSELGIRDAFEPCYFYPKDLSFKADAVPHHNLVEACHVHDNQSSGIYVDGGNGNALVANTIMDNDKEGVCLDFYAAANLVDSNIFGRNGFRRRQSDDDLRIDMVLGNGRLPDGSAAAKVPNVSLDNAACNILMHNVISGGAGGGIKVVRAGFRNLFCMNTLADNNDGGSHVFTFPGILLGSAGSEVENDESGLDRTASFENVIFGNLITGSHMVGIVYDAGSAYNDTRQNLVVGQLGPPVVLHGRPNPLTGNSFGPPTAPGLQGRIWRYLLQLRALFR